MFRLLNPPTVTMPSGRRARHPGIASSLRGAIARGQVGAGESLPSTRELAAHFGVHRHTVAEALDSLVAEGWVEALPRRSFRVRVDVSQREDVPSRARADGASFDWRFVREGCDLVAPAPGRARYPLHSATPDPRLLPRDELRAAYSSVLRGRRADAFDLGDERGLPRLVRALGAFLRRTRGLADREILVTNGSQEAIALVAQALLAPGDVVVVGDPGYPPAWDAFRAAGARLVPVPGDGDGLDADAIVRALRRHRCRLVYLTPGRDYPTTASLSAARRVSILEATRRAGVPILEDDYDHEHHFRASPQPPLALDADHVVYVSTLSKAIAPSLRIGFLAAVPAVVDRVLRIRRTGTRGNDGIAQAAVAEWIEEGGFERHLRRGRLVYRERRDAAFAALERARGGGCDVTCHLPDGGLALWAHWGGIDTIRLAERARDRGVFFVPEGLVRVRVAGAQRRSGARIAFSRLAPDELSRAVSILAAEALALRPARR
ncbi:MAG TPA: PLP-dependent aminotransferase family protein [Polyangiaceae bacterium]|nr:PLP-dependent aminotransferase family protein [Polyangiaceae bacterium]